MYVYCIHPIVRFCFIPFTELSAVTTNSNQSCCLLVVVFSWGERGREGTGGCFETKPESEASNSLI